MDIILANKQHFDDVHALFLEYESFLNIDLRFQNFERELAEIPGEYSPPKGALFLALIENKSVGCAAFREFESGICEMKRLFVRPDYRRQGIGLFLAKAVIERAALIGYSKIRLDTLDTLEEAIELYRKLGFTVVEAYYNNPLPNVIYWEKALKLR